MRVPDTAIPLMPHQIEGAQFAIERQRVLIADEMGVGKTPTGIAIATASVDAGMKPVLVVVPPSMRLQWKREFARFSPHITIDTLTGTNPIAKDIEELPDVDVLIIGDTSLAGWKYLLRGNIAGIVIDECHRIKGGKRAKRSQACIEIARSVPPGGLRVAMSGTPLINKPTELVPIINVLEQESTFEGGLVGFLARYAPRINSYGTRGAQRLDELHHVLTDSFMLRRKRDQVLSLPGKGRIQLNVKLDDESTSKYLYAERNLFDWIRITKGEENARKSMKAEGLVRINELRRLSALGKVEGISTYVDALLEEGEQVFLTCAFTDEAVAYYERYRKSHKAVRVVGGMTDAQKMGAVDAFQRGDARVLVGNIVASGTGLTLTSGRHHVACSLPWTSADLLQCEDRLQRIGQERDVVSHVMLSQIENSITIDERMIALLEHKNDVLTSVLDGEATDLLDDQNEALAMLVLRSYGW